MKNPEFKLLPCIFCTIGFNCYVAGHKVITATYQKLSGKPKTNQSQEQTIKSKTNNIK